MAYLEIEEAPLLEFQKPGHLFRNRRGTYPRISKAGPLVQKSKRQQGRLFRNRRGNKVACSEIKEASLSEFQKTDFSRFVNTFHTQPQLSRNQA
ncbi:hypothetical protein ACFX1Z_000911 [Malus domestica]